MLTSSKTADWYEVLRGAILAGIPICLCSSALVSSELEQRTQKAKAKAFVGDAEQVGKMVAFCARKVTAPVFNPSFRLIVLKNHAVLAF